MLLKFHGLIFHRVSVIFTKVHPESNCFMLDDKFKSFILSDKSLHCQSIWKVHSSSVSKVRYIQHSILHWTTRYQRFHYHVLKCFYKIIQVIKSLWDYFCSYFSVSFLQTRNKKIWLCHFNVDRAAKTLECEWELQNHIRTCASVLLSVCTHTHSYTCITCIAMHLYAHIC